MANETTISVRTKVSGLADLQKIDSLLDQIKSKSSGIGGSGNTSFITKMVGDLDKATVSVGKFKANLKQATEAGGKSSGLNGMTEQLNKSISASEKLNSMLKETASSGKTLADAQAKMNEYSSKSAASAQKAAEAQKQAMQAHTSGASSANQFAQASAKTESSWSKIKGSIKDSLSMFSVGMLGASAVQGAVDTVKNAFKGGYDTIKERQEGAAMWSTSIQDAHHGVTGSALSKQANAANALMTSTAIKAGNDASEANSMAKQIYSSDAGVYSGNLKKTQSLVTGMFNIQDANTLNQMEMERFKTAVGNIGDTGKMGNNIAKSLNLLDGKMTRAMRDEYKRETGHELGKTKSGNWDYSKMSAQTAYRGLDIYGNSNGVGKASERFNSTLSGVTRAGKSAINNGMADFETRFANNVNKAFGGKSGLIGKASAFLTDDKNIKRIGNAAGDKLGNLAVQIGKLGKEAVGVAKDVAPAVKAFGSGFAKGFVSEVKAISKGISDAYNGVKGLASKFKSMIPKGAQKSLGTLTSKFGEITGKVTAFALALRGFAKLPKMAGVVEKLVSPITKAFGEGSKVTGFINKLLGINPKQSTAGDKMMTAAETMQSAANKMNGGSGFDVPGEAEQRTNKQGTVVDADGNIMSRAEARAAQGASKLSWSQKLIQKGEGLLGPEGSRVAANAGWFTKLKGNSLLKLGGFAEKIGGSKLGTLGAGLFSKLGAAGKFLGKGGGLMNALFSGIDVMSVMSSTKKGSNARHTGVGNAVGNGVGATIGGALGTALGPLGTIGGGILGGWLGGKLGGGIGKNWNKITKGAGNLWDKTKTGFGNFWNGGTRKGISKGLMGAGKFISGMPMGGLIGGGLKFLSNPLKGIKNIKSTLGGLGKGFKNIFGSLGKDNPLKNFNPSKWFNGLTKKFNVSKIGSNIKSKLSGIGKGLSNANPLKGVNLGKWFNGITKKFNVGKIGSAIKTKLSGIGKGISNANPLKGVNISKWFSGLTKKFDVSKMVSGIKTKLSGIGKTLSNANPLKGFSLSKMFGLGKGKSFNPFKGIKIPGWLSKITGWGKGAKDADKSTKSAAKSTSSAAKSTQKVSKGAKDAAKSLSSVGKTGTKGFKAIGKSASGIWKSITKGAKSIGKKTASSFKGLGKGVKSGLKSAQNFAKSGAKKISTNIKSGLKGASKIGKTAFKGVSKSVKSGLKSAQSSAKSGSKKIVSNIKSGLKGASKIGSSAFKGVARSVKSGLNGAKSAARSGARGITSAIKSGLSKVGSGAKSEFNKLKTAATSGMNGVKSAVTSGMSHVASSAKSGMSKVQSTLVAAFKKMESAATSSVSRIASSMAKIGSSASAATSKVRQLQNAISTLKSKTVTITANVKGKGAGKLATGTPGAKAPSHLAKGWTGNGGVQAGSYVVNDGKSSHWREGFRLSNGLMGLFPNKRNLRVPLPANTQVFNGDDTHSLFRLKTGTPGAKAVPSGRSAAPIINITVNVTAPAGGNASGSGSSSMANQIANAIGEKFLNIWPKAAI